MGNVTLNPIYINNNYFVEVGLSSIKEDKLTIYKIVNTRHSVVELETTILPAALAEADALDAQLDDFWNSKNSVGLLSDDNTSTVQ